MTASGPTFRRAGVQDVPAIVRLLAGDRLGRTREVVGTEPDALPADYWRAFEAVRVDSRRRGQGLGSAMLRWAIERARTRGCRLVQLITDKRRSGALRLYQSLGFQATHEGLKLRLSDP